MPIKGVISQNNSSFAFDNSGEIYESLFSLFMRPCKGFIGRYQSFTLKVTDRLGRTAVLNRNLNITDSRDTEIKVSMPSSVNAENTLTGTIIYPADFVLSKRPRIGDPRGFAWTSSDYTTFRINVNEEGVNHKRLFAIIASGTFGNASEEQVLTWKREYKVKSQNLIYDEERNRRRTEANNKAWRDAFSAVASGVSAAASAYAEANADAGSNRSTFDELDNDYDDGDDGFDQPSASPPGSSRGSSVPNYNGVNRDTGQIKPLSTITPRQPARTNAYKPSSSGGASSEITKTSVCDTAIVGRWDEIRIPNSGWVFKGNSTEKENGVRYDTVIIWEKGTPYDGDLRVHVITYFKDNCVMQSENIPNHHGTFNEYEYYHNGGKSSNLTKTISGNGTELET